MPSLPTVGGDNGSWGTKLNEYLLEEHSSSGTHLAASTTQRGVLYIASSAEAVTGVNDTKAVTPAGTAAALAAYVPDLGYTEYVVRLTQTGTNAPVATLIKNNLGYNPAWSYVSTGHYRVTATGAFPAATTVPELILSSSTGGVTFSAVRVNDNYIDVYVMSTEDSPAGQNDVLSDAKFRVVVYSPD